MAAPVMTPPMLKLRRQTAGARIGRGCTVSTDGAIACRAMLVSMDAKDSPTYLRATARAVAEFQSALEAFLELHTINTTFARGIAPVAIRAEGVEPLAIQQARIKVDQAAGLACHAPSLTNLLIRVQTIDEPIDPIAAWHTITMPRPMLEPEEILSACGQMIGRLEAKAQIAEAEAPPSVGLESLHPLVWGAARRLWRDGHIREAVAAASSSVVTQVKVRTGRNDVPETSLWNETYSADVAKPGRPRLRWPGDPKDQDVKAMNDGLRRFAPGVQMTIRNGAVHGSEEMSQQDGLERLAALSLLARWVEQCELECHDASTD